MSFPNYAAPIIKYSLLSIALFCTLCNGLSENIPFSDGPGYIAGGKAFDAEIIDANGKKFTLKDFYGNVVIIALSATWCPNCPGVIKSLDNLAEKLISKNIENVKIIVLNIGRENAEEIKLYYKSNNIQSLDAYDSINSSDVNDIRGVPTCLVFDTNGKSVCGYIGGGINFSSDKFINYIKKLLSQKLESSSKIDEFVYAVKGFFSKKNVKSKEQ